MVNSDRSADPAVERVLRSILDSVGDFKVAANYQPRVGNVRPDILIEAKTRGTAYRFAIEARSRITPQTAIALCDEIRRLANRRFIPVIYAPVISPRVAEIARQREVGYIDRAGNCWLRSPQGGLLIERQGLQGERRLPRTTADLFSPKSSRIVRLMLSQPTKGWQVRELAEHEDVQVSPGLAVKIKRTLLEEGYALVHQRLLYLRDPLALLKLWSMKYAGPADQLSLYVRGDTATVEKTVDQWCHQNKLTHALAGLSAAWRLAPETRYNVTAVYVEDRGFEDQLLTSLDVRYGGKQVDSGANVQLWRPFDQSVFAGIDNSQKGSMPVTSPIQTYLDSKLAAGRGEEAASAIFEKYLREGFEIAAERALEVQNEV
jgi:hypothetical protein